MGADEIKKDFIRLAEDSYQNLQFPKNYFGCIMALLIEQQPITQDRIVELTGYSKATISQMLNLIQMNVSLTKVKKPKIRKKFYIISTPPRMFMLEIFNMILDSYKGGTDFVPPLLEEIAPYVQAHVRFQNFHTFLKKFYDSSATYLQLLADTSGELHDLIQSGRISGTSVLDNTTFQSPENMMILQKLMLPPQILPTDEILPIESPELSNRYRQLKDRFYQEFRSNLNSNAPQVMVARTVIGTELLLENRPITQAEIEDATNFARSLISDALAILLKYKMVRVIKKPKDRKNYYVINQSWDVRTISRIRVFKAGAMASSQRIAALGEKAKNMEDLAEKDPIFPFLEDIHHTYTQLEQYYKFLEMKFLNDRIQQIKTETKVNPKG